MERNWRDAQGIERVDYDTEYGLLADDATAGCLLEAAEYFGPGLDEDGPVAPAGAGDRAPRSGPEPLLTRPLQATFCEHLARHGNVRLACRAAGVSPQTAYRMRRACRQFRALWDAALVIAREQVEDVLADRAIHGWEEAVFYHGEEVARRRRYDSRLLLAHLARLDRLAERAAGGVVERFDAALDTLSADEELVLAPAEAAVATVSGVVGVPAQALRQAQDERTAVSDGERPQPALGLSDEGTPLLEAQLCWLDEQYGPLGEEEEVFHLLHTVPGVPGSALRRFGWTGSEAELAADRARWAARRAVWQAESGDQERVPAQAGTSGCVAGGLSPAPARC